MAGFGDQGPRGLQGRRHRRLAQNLVAAGFELIDGVPIPGYDRFEFRDPFGNRVEMILQISPGSSSRSTCETVKSDVLEPS